MRTGGDLHLGRYITYASYIDESIHAFDLFGGLHRSADRLICMILEPRTLGHAL